MTNYTRLEACAVAAKNLASSYARKGIDLLSADYEPKNHLGADCTPDQEEVFHMAYLEEAHKENAAHYRKRLENLYKKEFAETKLYAICEYPSQDVVGWSNGLLDSILRGKDHAQENNIRVVIVRGYPGNKDPFVLILPRAIGVSQEDQDYCGNLGIHMWFV